MAAILSLLRPVGAQQTPAQQPAIRSGASITEPQESMQLLDASVGQTVSSIELAGRPELNDEELLPLIAQHAGEPLDRVKLERTVAAIKATGKFKDVQLTVIPDVEGVRVLLILQPAMYFGIYTFPGSKEFPYSRLLQVTNYPPEGPFNRRDVATASQSLTKFFQQNGYFLAKVTPQVVTDTARGIVDVHFAIEPGRRARFGDVTLSGASVEQAARLQAKLKSTIARLRGSSIRRGRPYSLKGIQNATLYLQNALVKQEFLDAQVRMIGAEYDPASNLANISFHIAEGPTVQVKLEGAHVRKATQHKLLPLYQQVGVNDELVQEGRNNLISYFQSKGYFNAAVETSITPQNSNEVIVYRITKASKHRVSSVSFDGNKALGGTQLLRRVSVKEAKLFSRGAFSDKLLRSSARNLEATYRAEGFSAVRVTPKVENQGRDINVTFMVEEGPRDTVRELKVVGNSTMPLAQVVPKGLKLAAGQPYSQSKVEEDRRNISVKYLESGYLTMTFRETVASEKDDPHGLTVTYEIREGPRVTTSSVITLGRVHTRQRVIDRAAKLSLNAPLATGEMLGAESRLYSTGVFDWAEVGTKRQITTQSTEDVLVKVHEARRNTLTYGLGFEVVNRGGSLPSGTVVVPGLPPLGVNSNFVTSQKTFWGPRGSIEYTRRNILGLAETLTVGSLAGRLIQRVSANFQNPSFRGASWASDLSVSFEHNSENPIYTDRLMQSGFQLQKPLNHKKTQHLILRYSFGKTQITNLLIPELVPNSSDLNVRLSTLSATYSRDTRDNQLDATRGIYQSVEADVNPEALGSSVSFVKMLEQVAYYKRLPPSHVIWANSVRLGMEKKFADSHVPLSQELFSGGGSTLRGFPLDGAGPQRVIQACGKPGIQSTCENITVPNGGRQLFIVNSELRVPLPMRKGLGAAVFYDGGNVFSAIGFHGQYTNTVGGGFRYATPVGPIRIDVGHNLNSPRGITSTQFFITLGQAF